MIRIVNTEQFSKAFDKILYLDQEFFPFPWSKNDWKYLDLESHFLFCDAIEPKGFILFKINSLDKQAHLLKIVVDSNYRKLGIGEKILQSSLLAMREDRLESVFLEVSTDNNSAICLYNKFGFKTLVEKKKFYSDGSNAKAMLRVLT